MSSCNMACRGRRRGLGWVASCKMSAIVLGAAFYTGIRGVSYLPLSGRCIENMHHLHRLKVLPEHYQKAPRYEGPGDDVERFR
jgi:hypothetical protein